MDMNAKVTYVYEASGNVIVIKNVEESTSALMADLGFYLDVHKGACKIANNEEKVRIFSALRDLGVCFAAGSGWSPAAVFEYLRENALLSGQYKCIAWLGKGDYRIEER